jgi:hypothetical protein
MERCMDGLAREMLPHKIFQKIHKIAKKKKGSSKYE